MAVTHTHTHTTASIRDVTVQAGNNNLDFHVRVYIKDKRKNRDIKLKRPRGSMKKAGWGDVNIFCQAQLSLLRSLPSLDSELQHLYISYVFGSNNTQYVSKTQKTK